MKKIFALILCLMLIAVPMSVYADEVAEEITTEEVLTEETPAPAPEENKGTDWNNIKDTFSGAFVEWIEPNLEEIGVIVALFSYGIAMFKKLAGVLKSLGIMNNNTITISKENATLMEQAMSTVTSYEIRIKSLLDSYNDIMETLIQTADDKQRLETELVEIKNYLKISADANLEFSNELAELLGLANIPNYVKEEIGARQVAAKKNIIEAEKRAEAFLANPEEVTGNDGEKQED